MSDRFRDMSESEQRIAAARRDGFDVFDRQGRSRFVLGGGPESQLARGVQRRDLRPAKDSTAISAEDFQRLYTAVATANLMGVMLNTFVTIAWGFAGADARLANIFHDKMTELMRAWFRDERDRRGWTFPYAMVWTKEVGKTLGAHTHLLVHVPDEARHDFRNWIVRLAHRLVEAPRIPGSAEGRLVHSSPPFKEIDDQWRVFRYMAKGIDEDDMMWRSVDETHRRHLVAEFAGLKPTPQGQLFGKRTGFSREIGPKALQDLYREIGYVQIWPEASLQDRLRYDAHFLSEGQLRRQLNALDV